MKFDSDSYYWPIYCYAVAACGLNVVDRTSFLNNSWYPCMGMWGLFFLGFAAAGIGFSHESVRGIALGILHIVAAPVLFHHAFFPWRQSDEAIYIAANVGYLNCAFTMTLATVRASREQDYTVCFKCKYPLLGSPRSGTCPECGEHIKSWQRKALEDESFKRGTRIG